MMDKSFVFCPMKPDGWEKKIHDHSKIPTNMTLPSGHFKISSKNNKNPFEKQKVWKTGKEVKGERRNPIIYLLMAIATNEDSKDLIACICHKWHRSGGNLLRIKELQLFESKTICCLFNFSRPYPRITWVANSVLS